MEAVNDRGALSSLPEDVFVELFAQVFGFEKIQLLSCDHPVEDIQWLSENGIQGRFDGVTEAEKRP